MTRISSIRQETLAEKTQIPRYKSICEVKDVVEATSCTRTDQLALAFNLNPATIHEVAAGKLHFIVISVAQCEDTVSHPSNSYRQKASMDFFNDLSIELTASRCDNLRAPSYVNLTLSM
jgi:hypothetical protein